MPYSYYDEETDDINRVPVVAENGESIYFSYNDSALTVPQGYTKVQYIAKIKTTYDNDKYKMDSKHRFLFKHTERDILIDTAELRAKNGEQLILQTSDPNYIFIPTRLNIIRFDATSKNFNPEYISVNGYFFGK